ncbi:Protein of unknown function [Gracilibacillus ureilyticus]|uniref:DUF3939 domain-containing protein n=1 Tax=Gracilibacillus ureilyticus TaxID=531814 RepID=A0A1H9SLL0_9BACI|nr:DUF3939 domain-containing protein [Gracilibacillus ureilyticus]SER85920.1 Protein of unknown function [Gracilibacillus ureilyticus]
MWKKFFRKKDISYPIRAVSSEEVKNAVRAYSKTLPSNVPLKVLINEDSTINFELLTPFLKAFPDRNYYMSKETYEIFEEEDKHLALAVDKVQKAVDQYVDLKKDLPIIDYDPYRKVSYFKLEQLNLITDRPEIDFYITGEEYLITRKKPQ